MALTGLTAVSTDALRALLRHVHRGEVELPLTIGELTRTGLQYCAVDLLAQLRGLPEPAVVAVLTAVIAERLQVERAAAERQTLERQRAERAAADARAAAFPLLPDDDDDTDEPGRLP